jgi:hypothetical protein
MKMLNMDEIPPSPEGKGILSSNRMKMSYETYAYLRNYLEKQKEVFHEEYCVAIYHFGRGDKFTKAKDCMYKTYLKRIANIDDMLEQLKYAAGMSQGPNASAEEKAFWGLE